MINVMFNKELNDKDNLVYLIKKLCNYRYTYKSIEDLYRRYWNIHNQEWYLFTAIWVLSSFCLYVKYTDNVRAKNLLISYLKIFHPSKICILELFRSFQMA